MGTGARYERAAYGQARGEAKAIQEHQLAMIPIMKEQTEMQLELRGKAFEQELEQTKQMNLLSQQLQPDPILMPAQVTDEGPGSKNLVFVGVAILILFLIMRKK